MAADDGDAHDGPPRRGREEERTALHRKELAVAAPRAFGADEHALARRDALGGARDRRTPLRLVVAIDMDVPRPPHLRAVERNARDLVVEEREERSRDR